METTANTKYTIDQVVGIHTALDVVTGVNEVTSSVFLNKLRCLTMLIGIIGVIVVGGTSAMKADGGQFDSMLKGVPVTVSFKRALDLDRVERSQITMTFYFENVSREPICEFDGEGSLQARGQTRTVHLTSEKRLDPGQIDVIDAEVLLRSGNPADDQLKCVPLLEMISTWVTQRVKKC